MRKTLGMVVLSFLNEMIDEWTTESALIRHTYMYTWIVSSKELARCLTSEEPTEGEGVGVTVREGGRNL